MRNCFTPFGSVLDGGEIVCDVSFERSPIGGEPAEVFHKGHAGNGECADKQHQLDELSKRPVDEKSCDITSADSRQGRRSDNGNPARQAEEGSRAGEDTVFAFQGGSEINRPRARVLGWTGRGGSNASLTGMG